MQCTERNLPGQLSFEYSTTELLVCRTVPAKVQASAWCTRLVLPTCSCVTALLLCLIVDPLLVAANLWLRHMSSCEG